MKVIKKMYSEDAKERLKAGEEGKTCKGACRYCGQISLLEVPVSYDEDAVDDYATELCKCSGAVIGTRYCRKAIEGWEVVDEVLGDLREDKSVSLNITDELEEALKAAVKIVAFKNINSASFTAGGIKFTIKDTNKDSLKIGVTSNIKNEVEV